MKKALCLLAILTLFPCLSWATGTTTFGSVEKIKKDSKIQVVIIPVTFLADGSASMADGTLNPDTYGIKGWYLYSVAGDPGATGPTNAAWDFDITDATTGALLSGNLIDNQSSTVSFETVMSTPYRQINHNWTLSIGDNAVNNATVTLWLTFVLN